MPTHTSMAKEAVVYIVHSATGELLYVGVTGNLATRMSGHKLRSAWWSPDIVVTTEHFDRRSDANRREAELIERLKPPFNPASPKAKKPTPAGQKKLRTVRMGPLWDQGAAFADTHGLSMTALVEEALRREIARLEKLLAKRMPEAEA